MGTDPCSGGPASHPALFLWPREAVEDGPKALGPCTHVGDLEETPGSWFRIGSDPAATAAWAVKQRVEDLPLRLPSSLYICFSNKREVIILKSVKTKNEVVTPSKIHPGLKKQRESGTRQIQSHRILASPVASFLPKPLTNVVYKICDRCSVE